MCHFGRKYKDRVVFILMFKCSLFPPVVRYLVSTCLRYQYRLCLEPQQYQLNMRNRHFPLSVLTASAPTAAAATNTTATAADVHKHRLERHEARETTPIYPFCGTCAALSSDRPTSYSAMHSW